MPGQLTIMPNVKPNIMINEVIRKESILTIHSMFPVFLLLFVQKFIRIHFRQLVNNHNRNQETKQLFSILYQAKLLKFTLCGMVSKQIFVFPSSFL